LESLVTPKRKKNLAARFDPSHGAAFGDAVHRSDGSLRSKATQRRWWSFIEVVSCGFAPMTVGQLSAGTAFEVKCPFAIDAIAAGYRADLARWGKHREVRGSVCRRI
jgi:hypothetical protein